MWSLINSRVSQVARTISANHNAMSKMLPQDANTHDHPPRTKNQQPTTFDMRAQHAAFVTLHMGASHKSLVRFM